MEKNWKEPGMYKEIFDHIQKTQRRKITDKHVMIIDHTSPGETYEIIIRKSGVPVSSELPNLPYSDVKPYPVVFREKQGD